MQSAQVDTLGSQHGHTALVKSTEGLHLESSTSMCLNVTILLPACHTAKLCHTAGFAKAAYRSPMVSSQHGLHCLPVWWQVHQTILETSDGHTHGCSNDCGERHCVPAVVLQELRVGVPQPGLDFLGPSCYT